MKPNLLLILSDQHRWCDMNYIGNNEVLTPNFDSFAKEAAVLTHCISNSPVCVPARGSLLTGQFPLRHKAVSNDLPIDPKITSIADVMNESGYHTGYIGKWHLAGIPRDQFISKDKRLGFKEWKVANCTHDYLNSYYHDEENIYHEHKGYEPTCQTDLALKFIEKNASKEPWGLVLSWGPPHAPYHDVPKKFKDIYKGLDPTLRKNVKEPILLNKQKSLMEDEIKEILRGYYAHITALDEEFGRIINKLEETEQLDNTIVVYMSDHGDMLGSQGVTKKQWPYEESIRVPLMVYWKGHTLAIESDELIGLVDLPVSLMSLMGISMEKNVDGQDLSSLFTKNKAQGLDACYIMDYIPCHQAYHRGSIEWRGIRTKEYTYASSATGKGYALFNNEEDPYQLKNLVLCEKYLATKEKLNKQLMEFVNTHDALLEYKEFIDFFGLKEEWNKSQSYFRLPLL